MDQGHIIKNLNSTPKKNSIQSSRFAPENPVKRPDPLPHVNFSVLKDQALRKKLQDHGLNAGGTRQMLEKRYMEWMTLWNANCDSTKPKSKIQLQRELDVWERTQGPKIWGGRPDGVQIKDKDFDGNAWATKHDDSFRDLIAKARKKAPSKIATPLATASNIDINPNFISGPLSRPPASVPATPLVPLDTEMAGFLAMPTGSFEMMDRQLEQRPVPFPSQDGSRRRFFEESSAQVSNSTGPSFASPYQNNEVMEDDTEMVPELHTIRPTIP
jgi:E3 ubiquitin-protein ligase RAD18